jgi:SAM-dependent methyltransferase
MGLLRNWSLMACDLRKLSSIPKLPRYFNDWMRFNREVSEEKARFRDSYPCLTDWTNVTRYDTHNFYQAFWVMNKLVENKPDKHVDIGSNVLIIAAISAFVETTFIDFRPLEAGISSLNPLQGDIINLSFPDESFSSISCLHVIEHIGLGRYGDKLDPKGSEKAARELARVLAKGGRLLLSTPVGRERVCFNAHRVFKPHTIVGMFSELKLLSFAFVDDKGTYNHCAEIKDAENNRYACGMFEFKK